MRASERLPGKFALSDICSAVWVDSQERFVSVRAVRRFRDRKVGHSLWKYAELDRETGRIVTDTDGEPIIRACLLHVPAGGQSPNWHIPSSGGGEYYGVWRTVAGSGKFVRQGHPTVDSPIEAIKTRLPESPDDLLEVMPGDTFQLQAFRIHGVGLLALATFNGAPFKSEYEERVD